MPPQRYRNALPLASLPFLWSLEFLDTPNRSPNDLNPCLGRRAIDRRFLDHGLSLTRLDLGLGSALEQILLVNAHGGHRRGIDLISQHQGKAAHAARQDYSLRLIRGDLEGDGIHDLGLSLALACFLRYRQQEDML